MPKRYTRQDFLFDIREELFYAKAEHFTPDFRKIDLNGEDLHGLDFCAANLSQANLYTADLSFAVLIRCTLRESRTSNSL
jgi:uncharacterized protein YjbI with pentapeptide repeats